MVKWCWKGETEVTGGKEKLDSVPLRLTQMTKASRDLICHMHEEGRHCLRRKGTKICGGVCGYCQPNCQHSRIKVNERTPCIHRLCLRTCLMLNNLYTSDVPQNMSHVEHPVHISCASCWTPCIHQMCLRTCLILNTCIHQMCLRTCLMLNTLYT